jgi:hypothetical protein
VKAASALVCLRAPVDLKLFRMNLAMTFPTEGDEIFFGIMAKPTSRRDVVNFQSRA